MQRKLTTTMIAVLVSFMGCADVDLVSITVFDPATDSGSADFSVLVAVGNSLTAGVQNAGLNESRQRLGYAAVVARQLQKIASAEPITPSPNEFVFPGISEPGTEGTLVLTNLDPLDFHVITDQEKGSPLNLGYPIAYNNMGLPGARVEHVVEAVATGTGNGPFDLVLRQPGLGTALDQASSLQPTFVLLWIGTEDVWEKMRTDRDVTDAVEFEADYRTIVTTLTGLASSPDIVAGNIPDVTSIPYATTVPPVVVNPLTGDPVLDPGGNPVPLIGPDGLLSPDDLVTLEAIFEMEMGLGIPIALGGTGNPLSDAVVINTTEQAEIAAGTDALNAVIASIAAEFDFPVVDANGLLAEIRAGLPVGGIEYTTEYILGGAISVDGVHPSDLGHALAANAFISTINNFYGSSIPLVDLSEYTSTVFDPGAAGTVSLGWSQGLGRVYRDMGRLPVFN